MKHRVLIVDDEPRVLTGLTRALRREPYDVVGVTSAAAAMDVLAERPVDAVISDHDMPGMTGTAFLSLVAEHYPETVRFMLTGKPSLDVAMRAVNDGAVRRFFTKPCDEIELAIAIRQGIEQRDLMREAFRLLQRYKAQQAQIRRLAAEFPLASYLTVEEIEIDEEPGAGQITYEHLIDELRKAYGD